MGKNWTKYAYTCCLWFTYLTGGMINKQLGSALPDIQLRTHVQFTEASFFILAFCVGCLVGCLVAGLIYGRIPSTGSLCISCTGLAVSDAVYPWCDSALAVYVVHFAIGVWYMIICSTVVPELCALWGKNVAMPMLLNNFFFGIGGVASSAFTAPFLSTTLKTMNCTSEHTDTPTTSAGKLYIPFTISAILTTIAAILQLTILYKSSRNIINIQYLELDTRSKGRGLLCIRQILAMTLIAIAFLMIGALQSVSFFLPNFLLDEAHLSMSNAAYTLSLYTTFQVIGNLIEFILVENIGNYRLIIGHSVIYISSLMGLWNCVTYGASISVIYVTGSGIGLGKSVLHSSITSFVEMTVMPVTGSVSGFLFASEMIGEMVMSSSIGYLSDRFTHLMFIYVTLSEMLLFLLCIVMTQFLNWLRWFTSAQK